MFSKPAKCLQSYLIVAYEFLGNFNHVKLVTLFAMNMCGALRNLVSFVQFEKREKHPWRNVNFSKVWLQFFRKFSNDSNCFVNGILLVSTKAEN